MVPSSVPEVAPFPAGLNDCVSGLKWVVANAGHLGIDPARIIVAGESGGGNLTLATGLKLKQDGELGLIKGLYALCPYIAGQWPTPECPSSTENNGILLELHNNRGAIGYGIEAFNERNPLAWPSFATVEDVQGFPPTVISVNECDPLRDEGINFYRLLLQRRRPGPLPAGDGHDATAPRSSRSPAPRSAVTPPATSRRSARADRAAVSRHGGVGDRGQVPLPDFLDDDLAGLAGSGLVGRLGDGDRDQVGVGILPEPAQ